MHGLEPTHSPCVQALLVRTAQTVRPVRLVLTALTVPTARTVLPALPAPTVPMAQTVLTVPLVRNIVIVGRSVSRLTRLAYL